jgi:hypothetical protein
MMKHGARVSDSALLMPAVDIDITLDPYLSYSARPAGPHACSGRHWTAEGDQFGCHRPQLAFFCGVSTAYIAFQIRNQNSGLAA